MSVSRFSESSRFSRSAMLARAAAVAIAIAAIVDPVLSLQRAERPPIRVIATGGADTAPVSAALQQAGFALTTADSHAATVIVGDRPPEHAALSTQHRAPSTEHRAPSTQHRALSTEHSALSTEHSAVSTAVWALETGARSPNVRVGRTTAAAVRLPEQAVVVSVDVLGEGVSGQTTAIVLEDAGIVVATSRHAWTRERERWRAALQYLPPGSSGGRLRVIATPLPRETRSNDNVADVALPVARGPVRLLVIEAGVTWPAVFVRRALEGEAAFAVSALQRASKRVATRAGSPPAALTRGTLVPFEVALVGGPDNLTTSDLDALRWFVESRGGVVVFVPDQRPVGRYGDLAGVQDFESRIVEAPLTLTEPGKSEGSLSASELLVPKALPPGGTVLAADSAGAPVVFVARRGAGAVIVSGALDAWRHRADDRFARFWRRAIAEHAAAVPPALDVTVDPALVRPGETTIITARMRGSEVPDGDRIEIGPVSARAIDPRAKVDVPIRLWPLAEPGVYAGEWRPPAAGTFDVSVVAGPLRGDAVVAADAGIAPGSAADPDGLALIAHASGGGVFPSDQSHALVSAMGTTYPARTVTRAVHPMRSAWWAMAFAGLLCAEWAVRRKRGLS